MNPQNSTTPVGLVPARKPSFVTPAEFFQVVGVDVSHPSGVQAVVFEGPDGSPCDHSWCPPGAGWPAWAAANSAGRKPAYFTMAAFDPQAVQRFKGRTQVNAVAVRGFWLDIEGSAAKYTKPGGADGGYPDGKAALQAVTAFSRAVSLKPNFVVLTGSGGAHLHYVLQTPLKTDEWLRRARLLNLLAKLNGLKIDAQCTTDAARIMRAPGSLHQATGAEVRAYRLKADPFTLPEFDEVLEPARKVDEVKKTLTRVGAKPRLVERDGVYPAFSYARAAEHCGAMRLAAQDGGRSTPHNPWILAVVTAGRSSEGRDLVHEISSNHPEYDPEATDVKLASLSGGPANCETWEKAYGEGGPCETCQHRSMVTNPATQLGALPNPWVAELNARFAQVRHGTKHVILDFKTPRITGRGISYGIGILEAGGFRSMYSGSFVPFIKPGEKERGLANAWLAHPQRRQYEGLVYAPGEPLPADILNLWQGFAVEPVAGDVSLWLEVLTAQVPDENDRLYVLRWLAWKIQNPGGVPDTTLIFVGAKGTGKNSLFDPVLLFFGHHGMLADDAELIAGRFTGHLMTLSFAVLDEAVFIGDPRQADRIKSRVTAKTMHYEQKGMDAVPGVNRCAYVMLTNHEHVWQATTDERRAVVLQVGEALRGKAEFWTNYHQWVLTTGTSALLHYLQQIDLTGFNPRVIPKSEALRRQVELTALRTPVVAWWHQCLTEGVIHWRESSVDRAVNLSEAVETEIDGHALRLSYEQSAAARGKNAVGWSAAAKQLKSWSDYRRDRPRSELGRTWRCFFTTLPALRTAFTRATRVQFDD
jgi:hypothetical protein